MLIKWSATMEFSNYQYYILAIGSIPRALKPEVPSFNKSCKIHIRLRDVRLIPLWASTKGRRDRKYELSIQLLRLEYSETLSFQKHHASVSILTQSNERILCDWMGGPDEKLFGLRLWRTNWEQRGNCDMTESQILSRPCRTNSVNKHFIIWPLRAGNC